MSGKQQTTTDPREVQDKQAAVKTAAALQHGELPHNPELDVMLERAAATLQNTQVSGNLSAEGQRIAQDATQVVKDVKLAIDERNRDEHLQKMHLHAIELAKASYQKAPGRGDVSDVSGKAKEAVSHATTLARSIVLDAEFRTTIWELSQIMMEVFRSPPGQNQPGSATDAAKTKLFGEQPTGGFQQGLGSGFQQQQTSSTAPPAPPPPPVFSGTAGTSGAAGPSSGGDVESDDDSREDLEESYRFGSEDNSKYTGIFLSDEPISEEKLRGITDRFAKLAETLHSSPERRDALRNLVDVMSHVSRFGKGKAQTVVKDPNVQYHSQQWSREAQALVESFAMNKSLDPLVNGWRAFLTQTQNDDRFRAYFKELREFFFKSLDDPSFVRGSDYSRELRIQIEKGRNLLREYRALILTITTELDDFLTCLRADDMSQRLVESTNRLARDLFLDEGGRMTFKPGTLLELRKLVVPLIIDQLRYIAIPKISGSDETMDYTVDNLVFRGRDVFPDHIRISNMNYMDLETRLGGQDRVTSSIFISVANVQAALQDIQFSYQRKTVPKLSDVGQLDLYIQGKGISIDMWLSSTPEPGHLFRPSRIAVHIQSIKLRNIRAEHKFLYKLFRPIIQNRLRRALVQAIEEQASRFVVMLDEQMVSFANRAVESTLDPTTQKLADPTSTTGGNQEPVWAAPAREHTVPGDRRKY